MNKQRETIYGLRRQLLEGTDQKEFVMEAADRVVEWLVEKFCPKDQHADQWNIERPAHGILGKVRNRPEEARPSARSQTPGRAYRPAQRPGPQALR